jgi:hypothetical protein
MGRPLPVGREAAAIPRESGTAMRKTTSEAGRSWWRTDLQARSGVGLEAGGDWEVDMVGTGPPASVLRATCSNIRRRNKECRSDHPSY